MGQISGSQAQAESPSSEVQFQPAGRNLPLHQWNLIFRSVFQRIPGAQAFPESTSNLASQADCSRFFSFFFFEMLIHKWRHFTMVVGAPYPNLWRF